MKPKIGIIICGLSENRQYVTDTYVQAVLRSGGLPLIIPLVKSSSAIDSYTALCDGFYSAAAMISHRFFLARNHGKESAGLTLPWICFRSAL